MARASLQAQTKLLHLSDVFKYAIVYALLGISESHKTNKMLGLREISPLGCGFESHPVRWRHTLTAGRVQFQYPKF